MYELSCEYQEAHEPCAQHEDAYCAVNICLNMENPAGSYTCQNQGCKDLFIKWLRSRQSVRDKITTFVREQGSAGALRKIPQMNLR